MRRDRGEPISYRNGFPIYARMRRARTPSRQPSRRLRQQIQARASVRELVLCRAGGACEGCGNVASLDYAHRWPKRMGGTRRLEDPRHALALCRNCHRWQELNPEAARADGWTVDGTGLDAPVRLGDGRLVRLTVEGGYAEP